MKRYFEGFVMVAVLVALIGLIPTVVSAEDTSPGFNTDVDNQTINTDIIQLSESTDGDFEYTEWGDGVSITRYNGSGGDVEIPYTLGGKNVVAIAGQAFESCFDLTTIVIPDSVTAIGDSAFAYCSSLKNIKLPAGVSAIGGGTFLGCKELENIVLPDKLTSIGSGAFTACFNLKTIEIPDGVTHIGDYTFESCNSLKNIKLPAGVSTIGTSTFTGCLSLESIELPDKLTDIGREAFAACPKLTEINLSKNVKSIASNAFIKCPVLSNIFVASDNPNFTNINGLLYNKEGTRLILCPNGLKTVTIPESVTCIGSDAFSYNENLEKLNIPKSVLSIEQNAFIMCSNLTSIDIPASITKINDYTFEGCRSLTTINLPGVVHIKTGAFQYCPKLKTINMPKVILIEAWTFSSCESLKNIIIPESTTLLDFRAFIYTDLETIQFPSSTTAIDDDKLTIPATATIIGYDPSTAKAYASKYNRKFKLIGEPAELESIAITSPAQKLNYIVSEPLDLNGLVVTGTYSDGSTKTEAINEQNVSGFDSSKVAKNQLLTININGKTTTYTIQVGASDTGINCLYHTHVQDVGWQSWKSNGGMSGTEGRSLRLEGIEIKLDKTGYDLGISYQTHIQDIGWEAATPSGWKSNGVMSGTESRSLRLEAIQIKLTGADANRFDVYYQVHAENFGWMGWAKNGESAGTAGFGYRLEGIRIKIVPKDAPAPGVTDKAFIQK